MPDIWFPYLGIEIEHLSKIAFTIGNISVAWYGILISVGVICGLLLARQLAKKSGQDPDFYTDFLIYALIIGLLGARFYYVAFQWDLYKDNLISVFDFRSGGLGIYGGVIAAVITAVVYSHIKKKSLLELLDTAMPGLILGQAIGRWGNFFNQECFGSYTDNFFAMRLNVKTAAYTTTELTKMAISKGGVTYIQVHPTFLYESFGCLVVLAVMLLLFKKRKFKGEIAFIYMIGYGLLRSFVESLRTDQLLIWNTNIPVSVIVSAVMALAGVILMIVFARKAHVQALAATEAGAAKAPDLSDEKETSDSEEAADETEESEDASAESEEEKENAEEDPDENPEESPSEDVPAVEED
ncbi:MAG: prolipoprotein diacylglyceryl transferase, partial [Erysipelotrichaceae bacterium]|nr:prolipoprotein diacylglyceryl transferase [Erysipelotrichaceae bacterium]